MKSKDRIIKAFIDLIEIDSPSGKEEKVSAYLQKRLKELRVDFKVDDYGNIIAKVPGQGQPLLLSSHMDTVDPCLGVKAQVKGDWITSVGETILGADDKAGITEIIEAVRILKEEKRPHRPLELVFTREEEIGIVGAASIKKKELKSKEGLVLDKNGVGNVSIASPFIIHMDIVIQGRAAHAGAEPEKGISAVKVAADAISKIKIGRIDAETTNNIGILQSGDARNGVPEYAHLKAEARSHVRAKAERQVELYKKAFQNAVKKHGAKLKFKVSLICFGYKYDEKDHMIQRIVETYKSVGVKPNLVKSGGASDVNAFVRLGITAVDISYGGEDPHTTRERIKVSSMAEMVEFVLEFCRAE